MPKTGGGPSLLNTLASMTKCPDCRKRVSSRAVSCPHCGCPFRAQTIEKTDKTWKALSFVFGIPLVLGLMALKAELVLIALPLLFIGGLGTVVASIGAWWENG